MRGSSQAALLPGLSMLGGAAAGFSYEGALSEALARRDRQRQQQAGQGSAEPPRQGDTARAEAPAAPPRQG